MSCREHRAELKRAEAAARNLRREAEEQRRAAAQSQAAVQRLENDILRVSTELASAEQENRQEVSRIPFIPQIYIILSFWPQYTLPEALQSAGT